MTRLARADPGVRADNLAASMRNAVLEPLQAVHGVGLKLWSMALADLLLAGDHGRERWVMTGAAMVAIDSLVHAFLHRTGILRRFGAEHRFGAACYAPGGCAATIEELAGRVDARHYNPSSRPDCLVSFSTRSGAFVPPAAKTYATLIELMMVTDAGRR